MNQSPPAAQYVDYPEAPDHPTIYELAFCSQSAWDPSEVEPEYDEGNPWAFEAEYGHPMDEVIPLTHNGIPLRRGPYIKKPIPNRLRWQVFRRDSYRCVHCHENEDLTADHIFPEVRGGQTILSNLQTLCRPCNSKKGAKV